MLCVLIYIAFKPKLILSSLHADNLYCIVTAKCKLCTRWNSPKYVNTSLASNFFVPMQCLILWSQFMDSVRVYQHKSLANQTLFVEVDKKVWQGFVNVDFELHWGDLLLHKAFMFAVLPCHTPSSRQIVGTVKNRSALMLYKINLLQNLIFGDFYVSTVWAPELLSWTRLYVGFSL